MGIKPKQLAFLLLVIFLTARAVAQSEPVTYSIALGKFKAFYNAGQPDSIFNLFSPELKEALPLDKFGPSTAQLKAQLGYLNKTDFIKINTPVAVYKATFQRATYLLNMALNEQHEFTGLRLSAIEAPAKATPADSSVIETPVTLKGLSGSVSGTLTVPTASTGKMPVVLIVPAGGQTDQDGNDAEMSGNTYKLLAYALAKNGIAALRYDKRLVGKSVSNAKENDLRFEDYVDDAVGFINMLNDDGRFSKVIVAGHGEGSLVGMMAVPGQPAKAFISLEGAGIPADKILTEQLKSKPAYVTEGFKRILDSLRRGKINPNVDPQLYSIARPGIQNYLMSWCRYDPTNELHKIKVPILIIQGTTDLQVSADNGQKLKSAKSAAVLTPIRGMNYILKDAPPDREKNMATYTDASLPLSPGMLSAVTDFIKSLP